MAIKLNAAIYKGWIRGCSASLEEDGGCSASLEEDGGCYSVDLARDTNRSNAKTICKRAAKTLRLMADRFERLAEEKDPFNAKVQERINKARPRKKQNG